MPISGLSGYKKLTALVMSVAWLIYEHTVLGKPAPELDRMIVALTALYTAVEGLKDAVIGFSRWWGVTSPGQVPADPEIPQLIG